MTLMPAEAIGMLWALAAMPPPSWIGVTSVSALGFGDYAAWTTSHQFAMADSSIVMLSRRNRRLARASLPSSERLSAAA